MSLSVTLGVIGGFVGGVFFVYAMVYAPLETKFDKLLVYTYGCEGGTDLFVPAWRKKNRPQFVFKQPDPPLE